MKKSSIISKLIKFHEEVFPSVGRGLSQIEYFSELLIMLEGEGMSPPAYVKKLTKAEIEKLGTNHTAYYTGNIRLQEWEDESE